MQILVAIRVDVHKRECSLSGQTLSNQAGGNSLCTNYIEFVLLVLEFLEQKSVVELKCICLVRKVGTYFIQLF